MAPAGYEERGREDGNLVLAPNEFAFILDTTKGNVGVYVGPYKSGLSNTDQPVRWNNDSGRYTNCTLDQAIQPFAMADESSYLVLTNPATHASENSPEHPKTGLAHVTDLQIGKKINIPGPITFALWPRQTAKVVEGHRLRSNQYVLVRVYNDQEASANWDKAVISPADKAVISPAGGDGSGDDEGTKSNAPQKPQLTMGQLLIIKGTDVSFYIPPTGIEVVQDVNGNHVRDAITLEKLEYCTLVDENGNKRIEKGPSVVFPEPTEVFVEKDGQRKFRAIDLNDNMGIHIKVTQDYNEGDEKGKKFVAGEELFITGKDTKIYFPREEHAIISYDAGQGEKRNMYYAVAIPAGEARYVLDKNTGSIDLVKGPLMFLPDPRYQVIVRRILDTKTVDLWFPGNEEAKAHNNMLSQLSDHGGMVEESQIASRTMAKMGARGPIGARGSQGPGDIQGFMETGQDYEMAYAVSNVVGGDQFSRSANYTPPRSITLNTKYEGAVSVDIWTGYAVQVVSKTGNRRVVVGPSTVLLEYDENLEVMALSTGKPKNADNLRKTAYLRVHNNKVSDIVSAETSDLVPVAIRLSYRVNFDGDDKKWFNVDNYVKLLTDHLRSKLRNRVKQVSIQEIHSGLIDIVRDTVLGKKPEDGSSRPNFRFEENDMTIYDVEILDFQIGDVRISEMLTRNQHEVVLSTLDLAKSRRELSVSIEKEEITQQTQEAQAGTARKTAELRSEEIERSRSLTLKEMETQSIVSATRIRTDAEQRALAETLKVELQQIQEKIHTFDLTWKSKHAESDLVLQRERQKMALEELASQTTAVVERIKAFSGDLAAALRETADSAMGQRLVDSLGAVAVLHDKSVAEVADTMFKGSIVESVIGGMMTRAQNKTRHHGQANNGFGQDVLVD